MASLLLATFAAAAIAGLVTSLMVPVVSRLSVVLRALDYPSERKLHADPTPRLGGLAVGAGLLFGVGLVGLARWGAWGGRVSRSELAVVLLGTGMVFVVGLVDDVFGVPPLQKILVETAAAAMIVAGGLHFSVVSVPGSRGGMALGILTGVVTVVWIVGATNAFNLIDGLDGLAGGVAAIIALTLVACALLQGHRFTVVLVAGLAGACLGFLRHNWEPARIFLGDAGSLTMGFLLAIAAVQASIKASAAVAILVPILVLGLPVMDTLQVMIVRFFGLSQATLRERVLGLGRADLQHVHHLLAVSTHSRRKAVAWLHLLTLAFCALAMVVLFTQSVVAGVLLVALEFFAVLGLRTAGLASRLRRAERPAPSEGRVLPSK